MKKFEFEVTITAASEREATEKMNCLLALGSKLSLDELRVLANTVNSPTALALAKQKLGL